MIHQLVLMGAKTVHELVKRDIGATVMDGTLLRNNLCEIDIIKAGPQPEAHLLLHSSHT